MKNSILIVFDFDETLLHQNGRSENFEALTKLKENNVDLAIASRNDYYYLTQKLKDLRILDLFQYVMADFRPKSIQLRHILWIYANEGQNFDAVYFIDDYAPNIERMKLDEPHVHCYQFGVDLQNIDELLNLIV